MVDFPTPGDLLGSIAEHHNSRNDLAVAIENGTSYRVDVNTALQHGEYDSNLSASILDPASTSSTNATVGVEAEGFGCGILIYLTGSWTVRPEVRCAFLGAWLPS